MSNCYRKYSNKRVNAEKEGIDFLLSFEDYKTLLIEAGITYHDVGNIGYHLARYNDSGHYEIGNCRFVHYLDNIAEKKISEKSRKASRENILRIIRERNFEERSRIGKIGGKRSRELGYGTQKLSSDEIKRRLYLISESDIDLMRYGWVSKVSKLLNISHTQVRRFMKQHYNKPYFIRRK